MNLKNLLKRIACLMLALLMLLSVTACKKDKKKKKKVIVKKKIVKVIENEEDDDEFIEEEEEEEEEEEDTRIRRDLPEKDEGFVEKYDPEFEASTAAWEGPAGYTIVYSSSVPYAHRVAENLKEYFYKTDGISLPVVEDAAAAASSKEILVGNSNRYITSLSEQEFAVSVKAQKLVFEGGHYAMVEKAADWFATLSRKAGEANTLRGVASDFKSEVHDGYKYVWGDEFDGKGIDRSKWTYYDHMGQQTDTLLATEETCPEAVRAEDGRLKMDTIRYYNENLPFFEYAEAMAVCNHDTMSYVHGYAEIRAMVPFIDGAWPAWWVTGDGVLNAPSPAENPYGYFAEVDIFECYSYQGEVVPNMHKWYQDKDGAHIRSANAHNYYGYGNNPKFYSYFYSDNENLAEKYNIYGFEWTENEIIFSVNGTEYMTVDLNYNYDKGETGMGAFKYNPLHFIFDNAVFTPGRNKSESGAIDNTVLPLRFYVDYIRLYQKDDDPTGQLNVADFAYKN